MKAAVAPAAKSPWEIREVETPRPGPTQVLIRIRASGICFTDVHQTRGELPGAFPRVLGHEPVGEIVEVGSAVATRRVGDRVGVPWSQRSCGRCEWCLRGKGSFCPEGVGTGVQVWGGHAEFMAAEAAATVPIPEGLSFEQAAPIFCAGYTVWSGLRRASPAPGERVAVVGTGGLGHLAVQYARAAGFETWAVTRSKDKEEALLALGASRVLADGAALQAAGGADVILGTSNSNAAMTDTLRGLRPDGRFVLMGFSTEPFVLPVEFFFARGTLLASLQNGVEYLHEALALAAAGKVKVRAETFPFRDIAKAYGKVERGEVRFRAVVTM